MINPHVLHRTTRTPSSCTPGRRAVRPVPSTATTDEGLSLTSAVFAGMLEETDPRLSHALGYSCPVYVSRQVWDQVIDRDDDPEHVDQSARMVDLLWTAKTSLDGHPWPHLVPFTLFPMNTRQVQRVNIDARRETGDNGEPVVILSDSETHPPFTVPVAGDRLPLPALDYEIRPGRIIPRVTVQVLDVILAALTDEAILSAFHIADEPDNPVSLVLSDGRTTTLRSHRDGSYSLGLLAEFTTTAA